MLYGLDQEALACLRFPCGEYPKDEIREMARRAGLPNADKADSQDICFIPNGDYRAFVAKHAGTSPGRFEDMDGRPLGEHQGHEFFTIGQRRNLGAQGPEPRYVVEIDATTSTVVIGGKDDVYATAAWIEGARYVAGHAPEAPFAATAKHRYKAPETEVMVYPGPEAGAARVEFAQRQRAVTPGQALVLYRDGEVIGGGVIRKAARAVTEGRPRVNLQAFRDQDVRAAPRRSRRGDRRSDPGRGRMAPLAGGQPHRLPAVAHDRVEDGWIQRVIQREKHLWVRAGWAVRFGMPEDQRDMGFDYREEQIRSFAVPQLSLLRDYFNAVRGGSLDFLASWDPDDDDAEHRAPLGRHGRDGGDTGAARVGDEPARGAGLLPQGLATRAATARLHGAALAF